MGTTVPMESAKPQEQTVDLEEKPFQDIVPLESQTKEFVEPFGTLSQNIASSEKNLKKANKSRDKSIPRKQETVLPMESIRHQEQINVEKEKAIQDIVPSESQIKE